MQTLQAICNVLRQIIYYVFILVIVISAATMYFIEVIAGLMSRNPKVALGAVNPVGSSSIVRSFSGLVGRMTTRGRGYLGDYVRNRHPRLYKITGIIFRKRRSRRTP